MVCVSERISRVRWARRGCPDYWSFPGFRAARVVRRRSGTLIRPCAIASRASRAGPASPSRFGERARRWAISPSRAGSPTSAPPSMRCTPVPTSPVCGSRDSGSAGRSRSSWPPTTNEYAGSPPSPRPRRCGPGCENPRGSSSTRAAPACCGRRTSRPTPKHGSGRSRTSIRSRRRNASPPDPGCSCTAAPTTSSRSTTRGGCVDLRIVANGAHRLRHDPRAIAAMLGWLDRQEP